MKGKTMKYLLSIFLTIIWLLCSACLMLSVAMMYPLFAFTFLGILFFLTIELNNELEQI